jgi:predicted DNA-binding ribbon-helix-helix protein
MKSLVAKRSIVLAGHKTSITIEDAFWKGLRESADERHESLTQVINAIDANREHANLSSAVRLFVFGYYRDQVVDQIAEGSALETLDPANTPGRRLVICSMQFRTEKSSRLGPLG